MEGSFYQGPAKKVSHGPINAKNEAFKMIMNWKFIQTKITSILVCNRKEQLIKYANLNNWIYDINLDYNDLKKQLILDVIFSKKRN
jgi:hypothetical protein